MVAGGGKAKGDLGIQLTCKTTTIVPRNSYQSRSPAFSCVWLWRCSHSLRLLMTSPGQTSLHIPFHPSECGAVDCSLLELAEAKVICWSPWEAMAQNTQQMFSSLTLLPPSASSLLLRLLLIPPEGGDVVLASAWRKRGPWWWAEYFRSLNCRDWAKTFTKTSFSQTLPISSTLGFLSSRAEWEREILCEAWKLSCFS